MSGQQDTSLRNALRDALLMTIFNGALLLAIWCHDRLTPYMRNRLQDKIRAAFRQETAA